MTSRGRAPTSDVAVAERPAESRRRADRARGVTFVPAPEPASEPPSAEQAPAEAPRLSYGVDSVATSAPAAPAEGQPAAGMPEPAAAPEPGVSAEQVAQREAQVAASQAALDSAADTPGLMAAFAEAPPTVKAQVSGELGSRFDGTLGQDTQALQQETPELQAEMQGNTPAPAGQIVAPAADVTLEQPPAEAPAGEQIVGAPVATEEEFRANSAVVGQLTRGFSPEGGAEDIGRALDSVQTSDPSIVTSPGSAPAIPLEGETDPQRMQSQIDAGSQQAQSVLAEQQAQAQALPGAERVQLADVHESYPLGELPAPSAEAAPAPEGAQQYLQLGQPPEVQTAFDDLTGASMQESMAEARGQIDQAAQDRDQQHQDAVDQAQRDTAAAEQQARSEQGSAVADSRQAIEAQRQSTLDQQQAAVADVEQQASDRSQTDRQQVDDRVRDDQAQLDDRYRQAESDAEAEVQRGEREAEAERQRAERESEDQSWWEAALDAITDLFDALVSLINDIFDAVRAAVNAVLDAVRDFALALIDLAADFLKGLISAFGEFLKGLVQGLLGELFPELAQALTELIDSAVELANSAIDAVAEGLKTAVNAIVEGLRAGLNRLIDIYQSAVNTALALARAALTGDWGAFIIQLIEAACRVAGLDPEQVFAFIGRAQETIQLIVDDPGQFLSNAVAALTGGIQRFADHFLEHLQAGIIAWLTGAIGGAGITLPERFDLMGVISLVAQILGLTWENLRLRLVRLIGERGVQVLEFVAGYIQTLIEGGWSALWERIQSDLGTLRDMVLEQIRSYLVERVIMAAITRLATLFNPIGALVNILIAAYQFYTFIRDQLQRIMQVVTVIVDAIGNIARGVLEPAQASVETFLAGLLPLALDLLARLLGLGDVGARVREILQSVQDLVWGAIDRLINWVVGLFRGGAGAAAGEPAAAAEGAAEGQIGERITFTAGGATHSVFLIRSADGVEEMVASTPMTVSQRLADWDSRKNSLPEQPAQAGQPAPRDQATQLIGQARTELTSVDRVAETIAHEQQTLAARNAATTGAPAPAATSQPLAQGEHHLAELLTQLFNLFGDQIAGGALVQRFPGQISAAHTQAQEGLRVAINALDQTARERNDQAILAGDWGAVRPALESYGFGSRVVGGPAFQALLREPFNIQQSPYTEPFTRYVTDNLLVGALRGALDEAGRNPQSRYAELAGRDITPDTFVQAQKPLMNQGQPPFTRSLAAVRTLIYDGSSQPAARQIFLDELVARARDASSSPFNALLSQADIVNLVREQAGRLSGDSWVAVFAAAGRAIRAERTNGLVDAGEHLTLEHLMGREGNADSATVTQTFSQQIYRALTASAAFMAEFSGSPVSEIQGVADYLARATVSRISRVPLYLVRPTDIPRDVPQTVPYVVVRPVSPGSTQTIAVAPALYEGIARETAQALGLAETQIHHALPLYAGGGHDAFSLAVVFGGASSPGSPHNMLHSVIDNLQIAPFLNTSAARVSLRVEDLYRHYRADLVVLIGTLYVDGRIEWQETDRRIAPPGGA